MEVHVHTHTSRKKWTHYFWEFLMLFLAVFCGFLAENQREHMIEHKREKKYAKTLYEDLKVDTTLLNAAIRERNFITPKIDTFRLLVHTKAIDEIPAGTWAYFGRFGTRNTIVSIQDATLQQLISSGGLRLFRKDAVADGIAQFDQALRDMKETFIFQDLMYSDMVKARNAISAIHRNLLFRKAKGDQMDSLIDLLREQKIKGYENELYYLGRMLVRTTRFQSNDRTITQLKFSGSMRLIRNENAADSIISYQKLVDIILANQEDDRIERRAADPLLTRMFNPFVFNEMLDDFNNIIKPVDNPPLRSYEVTVQQDLAYCINLIKGSNIIIKTRLELLNEKAKNTIEFLKEQYHLK